MLIYPSAYSVRRIVKRPDRSLKIFGPRSDEGEGKGSTPATIEIKFIAPDRLSADGQIYHRCKASPRSSV
ncbi:MAG: hypothetical protein ABWY35_03095 [Pseudorhodoplanes sp.]